MTKNELNKIIDALYEYLEIEPSDVPDLVCLEVDDEYLERWLTLYDELPYQAYGPEGKVTLGRIFAAYTALQADTNGEALVYIDDFTEDAKHLCVFCCRLDMEKRYG